MAGEGRRIAVVGSGVAGLTAAWVCAGSGAEVTLYEADGRFGGHADTHRVVDGGRMLGIDTGFIVHNRRTYPVLCRLFDELGVRTQESEMSMSVLDEATGLAWAGAKGRRGLFPTPERVLDAGHWRMLAGIPRFHRAARHLLEEQGDDPADDDLTLDDFLDRHRFGDRLRRHYIRPLVAAVWSCDPELAGRYPARYLFAFLQNHGMLSVFGSPTWRTVSGGSHEYVLRIAARLDEVRLSTPVTAVAQDADGVSITDATGRTDRYDAAVLAAHPGQSLAMLADPTPAQREVLSAMPYSANPALLHTDSRILPGPDGARASWNLRLPPSPTGAVTVTYDLTRLQRLPTHTRYLVTLGDSGLGGEGRVDPASVIARMDYEHPQYTPESVAAQRRLPEIDTDRIAFAGAYHGWGFHEDGARSGLEAARRLGHDWPAPGPTPVARRIYSARVTHRRRHPIRWSLNRRSSIWVADLDAQVERQDRLPRWRRVLGGTIEARDHLGDPARPIRDNLAAFLASQGVTLGAGRVRLMAHPRALGFCFNPISVWWCSRPDGSHLATVVEVHNTYGDRHAYLLPAGKPASVDKAMYVSPFHSVDGRYEVHAPPPDDRLDVRVRLDLPDRPPFHAAITGEPATGRLQVAAAAVSGPLDRAAITLHGVALWLRRLPVQPRPNHYQEGVR